MNLSEMIPVSRHPDDKCVWHLMDVVELTSHHISFKVHEVTGWDMGSVPTDTNLYLTGTIIWDGSSHMWFGEEEGEEEGEKQDGYLHLCGKFYWDLHAQVMTNVYEYAERNISAYDKEAAQRAYK